MYIAHRKLVLLVLLVLPELRAIQALLVLLELRVIQVLPVLPVLPELKVIPALLVQKVILAHLALPDKVAAIVISKQSLCVFLITDCYR
jgi:hypothetical protein